MPECRVCSIAGKCPSSSSSTSTPLGVLYKITYSNTATAIADMRIQTNRSGIPGQDDHSTGWCSLVVCHRSSPQLHFAKRTSLFLEKKFLSLCSSSLTLLLPRTNWNCPPIFIIIVPQWWCSLQGESIYSNFVYSSNCPMITEELNNSSSTSFLLRINSNNSFNPSNDAINFNVWSLNRIPIYRLLQCHKAEE